LKAVPYARRFTLSLIVTTALAVGAAPAQATFPGANGKLAISNSARPAPASDIQQSLAVVNPDGTGRSALAADQSGNGLFSPSGRRIAFQSGLPTGCCIFQPTIELISPGGTGRATVLPSEAQRELLGWSPDGARLLLLQTPPLRRGIQRVFSVALDGSALTQLSDGPVFLPPSDDDTNLAPRTADYAAAWSPGGRAIAFLRESVSPTGGSWSNPPATGDEVWVMRSDGTAEHQVTFDGAGKLGVAWSPRGGRIAYARDEVCCRSGADVWVVDPNGGHRTQLTHFATSARIAHLSWSPDGRRIAFDRTEPGAAGAIWTMRADGSDLTRLSSGNGPIWAPDSRRIAFTDDNPPTESSTAIWTIAATGGAPTQVTDTAGMDVVTDWQALAAGPKKPKHCRHGHHRGKKSKHRKK
jgi:hypothetical protein